MPKKVKFPIHITEVYQGIEADKTLDIGEIVQCLGCGQDIEINGETVSIGEKDDLPYVTCHNTVFRDDGKEVICGRKIFAPYYIEQREKKVRWKGKDVSILY